MHDCDCEVEQSPECRGKARGRISYRMRPNTAFLRNNRAYLHGEISWQVNKKKASRLFSKMTLRSFHHSFVGRSDHLSDPAVSRKGGRLLCHQWMDHPDRKPSCATRLQRCCSLLLCTACASAICSIFPLRLCFFRERGRSSFSGGALDVRDSAAPTASSFLASSFFSAPKHYPGAPLRR